MFGATPTAAEAAASEWDALRPSPMLALPIDKVKLRTTGTAARGQAISLSEVALLALGVSILFALLTVSLALFYRSQVGPGMEAVGIAQGPAAAPTLRPTYTATAVQRTTVADAAPAWTSTPVPSPLPALPPLPADPLIAERLPAAGPPTRLLIAKIGLDVPVVPVGTKTIRSGDQTRTVWADVLNAGGFHLTSAYPGWPGNTVINGHRDIGAAIFRHLDRLEAGDEIILYVNDVPYPYQVTEKLVVPETFASPAQRAENMRLIGYMPEERLTLVTCTPVGLATHRLLIIARPPSAPQMPEAGSTPTP